ncbi:hypothetical protein AB0D27_02125 [Streptomyces sp. NPDC048415]|uniref:HEAT repeat domain-containing protein n=1 Tax=Streptomyces sp. NPDC048415 TaxID=3154822 RepID=UPI003426B881
MNLAWIAAVLQPHDVAPHPNFSDDAYAGEPAGQLAALVIGGDWGRIAGRGEWSDAALEFAEKSLHSETIREGTGGLLRQALAGSKKDVARSAALALLASCSAAEMEDYDACESVLSALLKTTDVSASGRLVKAVLLQQRGLRRRDAGRDFVGDVFEAARLLEDLKAEEFPAFRLSPGVDKASSDTMSSIIYALKRASWSLVPHDQDRDLPFASFPSYMDRVKKPISSRLLRIAADRASVQDRYVAQNFRGLFENSQNIIVGASPIDLFHQTLAVELLGHSEVYAARKELALLRLVQHTQGVASIEIQDSLRLLRHAGATKELNLALERFRAAGPLSVLSWDARQILLRRTERDLLRVPELMVLKASSDLLAPAEAEQALAAVLSSIKAGGPPNSAGSWQHAAQRMGAAWLAAAALSNSCGQGEDLAELLLSEVNASNPYDELRDQNVAKAIDALPWKYVRADVKGSWERWLAREESRQYSHSAEAASMALAIPLPLTSPLQGLNDIAVRLNASLGEAGTPLSADEVAQAVSAVGKELRAKRASAATGSFAVGARSAADIAALLLSERDDAQSVWEDLAPFLTDERVLRTDRTPAFERLARERPNMPSAVRRHFGDEAARLLRSSTYLGPWDEDLIPYPSAFRFLVSYGLLDEPSMLASMAEMSGSSTSDARRQAARSLVTLAARDATDWLLPFALQMSHDSEISIKAHAARALARITIAAGELSKVAVNRLVALLQDEDGLLVPFYVLRELQDLSGLPPTVMEAVRVLVGEHPSRQVREAANEWLMSVQ